MVSAPVNTIASAERRYGAVQFQRLENRSSSEYLFFFFNNGPPPEISPLPLHDPFPIWWRHAPASPVPRFPDGRAVVVDGELRPRHDRSEEHTSELQSLRHLVCRLL